MMAKFIVLVSQQRLRPIGFAHSIFIYNGIIACPPQMYYGLSILVTQIGKGATMYRLHLRDIPHYQNIYQPDYTKLQTDKSGVFIEYER